MGEKKKFNEGILVVVWFPRKVRKEIKVAYLGIRTMLQKAKLSTSNIAENQLILALLSQQQYISINTTKRFV
jgi:hypothetical protein